MLPPHATAHPMQCSADQRPACGRVADWFAQLNNKMGGDLKKIQTVGQYFVEVWKSIGMEGIGDKVHLCWPCCRQ